MKTIESLELDLVEAQQRIADLFGDNELVIRKCQELEQELNEQARLNGMGAERELALMARLAEWQRKAEENKAEAMDVAHDFEKYRQETLALTKALQEGCTEAMRQLDAALRERDEAQANLKALMGDRLENLSEFHFMGLSISQLREVIDFAKSRNWSPPAPLPQRQDSGEEGQKG